MRLHLSSAICGLTLALCSAACSAQCFDSWTTQDFHCDGPHGCSQDITVEYPNGQGFEGTVLVENSVSCCGQLFSNFNPGATCFEVFKRPGVMKQVSQLAATSDLLVADCKGHYVLYEPPSPVRTGALSLTLVDNHVLR